MGQDFEAQTAALLFARGINTGQGFHLAVNMEAGGKFDDIVFTLYGERKKTVFMQLKHKRKTEKKITKEQLLQVIGKGDFSLPKYCASYCQIKKNWGKNKDLEFCGSIEDSAFIIYTNAEMSDIPRGSSDCSSGWPVFVKSEGQCFRLTKDVHKVFYDFFENLPIYKDLVNEAINSEEFSKTEELLKVVKTLWNNSNMTTPPKRELIKLWNEMQKFGDKADCIEFLSKLWFFTGQASGNDLNHLIKKEIETSCGSCEYQENFMESIKKWWLNANSFLTESSEFWEQFLLSHVDNISEKKLKELEKLNMRFQEEQLMAVITQTPVTIIVTDGSVGSLVLSCLKIHQRLSDRVHIMTDVRTLETHKSKALTLWGRGTHCNILVVEDASDCVDVDDIVAGVIKILKSSAEKKLVLVSGGRSPLARKLRKQIPCTKHKDIFKFSQLDEESQLTVLQHNVNFQGCDVSLQTLTGDNCTEIQDALSADTVTQLLSGSDTIKVGEPVASQDPFYISRTLCHKDRISMDVLQFVSQPGQLAVSGMSARELQGKVPQGKKVKKFDELHEHGKDPENSAASDAFQERQIMDPSGSTFQASDDAIQEREIKCYIYVIDNEHDFKSLCKKHGNIHWLHREGNYFVWRGSEGDMTLLRNHVLDGTLYSDVNKIMQLPQQVVLLISEPGMGKSTELLHLASVIKEAEQSTCVVRINLNDHTDYLRQNQPSAVELLCRAGRFDTQFQKSLLQHKLLHAENTVLLFDGFDEISPTYSDKVLSIVTELRDVNVRKMWITSRPVMGGKLENQFSALSFALKPFSEEDKVTFVHKFWEIEYGEELGTFIRKLLELTGTSVKGSLGKFADIPLHTMMLAEVFKPQALHYNETGEDKLPNKLNLLELYEGFRDRKWEIYQMYKLGIDTSKPAVSRMNEFFKNMFIQNHMECALITLLGHKEVSKLSNKGSNISKSVKEFLDEFKLGEVCQGFIVDVINKRAIFIHGTFVEFFVAEWLSLNYKENSQFAQDIILAPKYELMRHFFNRIMAKGSNFHNAILNQEIETVECLLSQCSSVLHDTDRGGRMALHLAVMSYPEGGCSEAGDHIVQILLEHKADHSVKDEMFHLSPLSLAERLGVWSAVNLLLQHNADKSDLILTKNNSDNDKYVQILLKEATSGGFLEVLKFVFEECGIDINYRLKAVDSQGYRTTWTPLMWAVAHCNAESVRFLLDKDVEIDARDNTGCTALYLACQKISKLS
ncbi:hypothetical protein B7P43_G05486 [Cryptotermes secundus]|nr:hypothetical protein B7P43_G05486 [Cryptotermes secundus]PNF34693.1 hypothetical protein B7P43_G05486 [Cryptotermes secundus]